MATMAPVFKPERFIMMDLVVVFKDMIEAQDKAQVQRISGQDHRFERVRAEKLEAQFNERMKAITRDEQLNVVESLVLDGYLDQSIKDSMDVLGGKWESYKTDYHRVALSALETIKKKVSIKDALDLASHSIKHMGYSWDDYYKIMAQVKKILKFS